ncbi:MAG: hypothetical protein J5935_02120, partial [Lachnospiraceae bacterium]|nr:hypothetical protein [Lachnospiraceae bacterium]
MCIRAKRKAPAFKQAPDIKIRADYKVLRNDSILSKATAVLIRSQLAFSEPSTFERYVLLPKVLEIRLRIASISFSRIFSSSRIYVFKQFW